MMAKCDAIVIFPIYGQFVAIRKSDSGRIVYKTYVSISINMLLLWVKVLFLPRMLIFYKKKKCRHQQD